MTKTGSQTTPALAGEGERGECDTRQRHEPRGREDGTRPGARQGRPVAPPRRVTVAGAVRTSSPAKNDNNDAPSERSAG